MGVRSDGLSSCKFSFEFTAIVAWFHRSLVTRFVNPRIEAIARSGIGSGGGLRLVGLEHLSHFYMKKSS